MTWKQRIAQSLRIFGYDLTRYRPDRHPVARLMQLMRTYETGLVLDVGANCGQYALDLRANGYGGRIVSFEPLESAFGELSRYAANDPDWETMRVALGAASGKNIINVAGNSTSSSLLGMLPAHEDAAPASKYVGAQEIEVVTLDQVLPRFGAWKGTIWLKIDTQGYEAEVLKGALGSLGRIGSIQLEMSLVPLYDGSETFEVMLKWMMERGFRLVGLQPGFTDPQTGRLLQVDGIFHSEP
jgi:FkbM family methyltransferase